MKTTIRKCILGRTALVLATGAVFAGGGSPAQMISVNFEQYTPSLGTPEVESELVGPAGGIGTEWNQFQDEDSAGPLVDSAGASTTVEFTTNFTEGRSGGGGNTPMLRSTLTDFGRGQSRTLTITGLQANSLYDIWLTSFRDSSLARERTVGTWSTTHPTTSPPSKIIDNRGLRIGTEFVNGYNYVVFENVEADGSGQIVFNGKGASVADGFDDDYRLGLSGFQITPGGVRVPLEITGMLYDRGSDEITLTWASNPGDFYGLYWSSDMSAFVPGIDPAVPAHGTENSTTYGPFTNPTPGAGRLFLKVGPPDLEPPTLDRLWGNGTSIGLVFSEAMHADPATDPGNYSVMMDGGSVVTVSGAALGPDGTTATLTLASALAVGSSYTVTMNNLTDLAGRELGNPTVGNFQTWDNFENGIKVFILAGQSNMVGHGKSEQGVGDVDGAIGGLRYMAVHDDDGVIPHYRDLLVDPDQPATSAWATRSDVQVWWRDSDLGAPRAVLKGDLGIGFAEGRNAAWFGPEYAFGWVVGDHYTEPVLIIKTSWGGKSLHVDYRPPSAVTARGGVVGPYYTGMIEYVRDVLSKLPSEFPAAQFPAWAALNYRYQIAGFGWHQGWNDRIDSTRSLHYEDNLVDLINDLRAEFGRPALPFSIGTTGMVPQDPKTLVELAQLAVADPAQHPEFAGTVFTVDTQPFWRDASVSPSGFGYHWNHNGESHFLLGDAMGRGIVPLLSP